MDQEARKILKKKRPPVAKTFVRYRGHLGPSGSEWPRESEFSSWGLSAPRVQIWGGCFGANTLVPIRESETTIKIKFALFRGGGGQGGKLSKTLFFMGNVMTIKF